MMTAAINRGGKPPKAGVRRYPGGQIHHADRRPSETPDEARATVLDARARQILGVDEWLRARGAKEALRAARAKVDDHLLGYALGRLLIVGRKNAADGITQSQHDAGSYFIWLYGANSKVRGWPSPNVRAIDYGAASGLSIHPEDSDKWVSDIKAKWSDMYRAIFDAEKDFGPIFEALKRVLIEDRAPDTQREIGALRIGLNAINRARGV